MRDASWTTEHVGEWRVALRANTQPGLAAELARVIARAAGPATGTHAAWEPLVITARDHEALLVDFANELVSRGEIAEEAPFAYKDVDRVAAVVDSVGIARRVARLRPLGVIKG